MSFWDEIRKVPPVTRFLCGSSLAVTLPVMLQVLSPYHVVFVQELVTRRYELWRVFTSFFLGSSGINYIFDIVMLYRNSNELESSQYAGRSADYGWQLLLVGVSIIALNLPLRSVVHTRPLLLALTYLSSRLAPAGSQTSLLGLINFPLLYLPYVLIGLDLIMGGPGAAAQSLTGVVAGHLWWWGVWDTGALRGLGSAPGWMQALVGSGSAPGGGAAGGGGGRGGGAGGGVHVVPPRQVREQRESAHRWGSGHRLGES
ncbi:Uncharacterized derlin-like protein [Sparassis crispa]|uniref:Derlin n=1 Tax=Sparassis crispa TaxID=139825 RepID=A0A401GYY6_9APHY|nr:Uncharacterized derlin-like protein [Sparassis crispa]GBE87386.1 Uncharacterized derlin-like protein [Sparassis crispa]